MLSVVKSLKLFCMPFEQKELINFANKKWLCFQLFSTEGGQTEIHTIAKALRDPEQLETEYLASYIERFWYSCL